MQVECSLQSGFEKGMKVEVANKDQDDTYWIASIVMSCGQLLRLRWDGINDSATADFWCDISSSDMHSLGWCKENSKTMSPPESMHCVFVYPNYLTCSSHYTGKCTI